ncbi:bone marrow proteoglycan-like [Dermochelys coriacea]|uniref:bone marrow proteoglycan-like n=1 Tax=Dermochelys coriacea TaxID=27794 RepID=UPI0018E739CA|nr:bone marrow proteoglycan-like [Dermochelys coriacea]XP_038263056.1 bone marrow proteoglycan-like [Dermochelys coriacea]XP_043372595.1 bone marrow proteoglycan-like [Dermochelys coriacea]
MKHNQSFSGAMTECTRMFRGHLASIHSHSVNEKLRRAVSYTHQDQVWVGGITSSLGGRTISYWVDHTIWNYSNWANGNPRRSGHTCVALCSADGLWRSFDCPDSLPFICKY